MIFEDFEQERVHHRTAHRRHRSLVMGEAEAIASTTTSNKPKSQ
ncbi:hypothetical protein [Nostoc sp. FACHB-892]|nr:hypothetical protein [Nostoc sp. FACHB-892]